LRLGERHRRMFLEPAFGSFMAGAGPGFTFWLAFGFGRRLRLLHPCRQHLSGKRRQAGGFEPVPGRPRIERDRLGLGRDRELPGDDLDPLGCRDLVGGRGLGISGCDVLAVLVILPIALIIALLVAAGPHSAAAAPAPTPAPLGLAIAVARRFAVLLAPGTFRLCAFGRRALR